MQEEKSKKIPVGRPSKYKPEFCAQLIEHMASGLSFESFAAVIDVCEDTLYEWSRSNPEFSEAKRIAFSKSRLWWEKLAVNYVVSETEAKISATIWVFNMKNRFPKEWRDRQEVETTGSQQITVTDFKSVVDILTEHKDLIAKVNK